MTEDIYMSVEELIEAHRVNEEKPMTVGELKNLIKNCPDELEILTVNFDKSHVFSRIKKVYISINRHPKDSWLTFELKET